MRRAIAVMAAAAALVGFASPAEAGGPPSTGGAAPSAERAPAKVQQEWTPWVPAPVADGDLSGVCSEPVHYTAVVNKERTRSRLIAGGNTEIEVKGALVFVLKLDSQPGRRYRFDISGSSLGKNSQISYTNGLYLTRATGPTCSPSTTRRSRGPVCRGWATTRGRTRSSSTGPPGLP